VTPENELAQRAWDGRSIPYEDIGQADPGMAADRITNRDFLPEIYDTWDHDKGFGRDDLGQNAEHELMRADLEQEQGMEP